MLELFDKLMSAIPDYLRANAEKKKADLSLDTIRRAVASSAARLTELGPMNNSFVAQLGNINKVPHPAFQKAQEENQKWLQMLAPATEKAAESLKGLTTAGTELTAGIGGLTAGAVAVGAIASKMSDSSAHELAHWDNSLAKSTGQLDKDRLIRTAQLARSTSELSSAYEKMANDAEKSWAPIKQQLTQGMYAVGTIFEKGKQLLGAGLSAVLSPVEATGEGIGEMIMGGNFFHGYNNALKPPRGVSMKDSPIMTWMTNLANAPLSVGIQPGHPLAVVPQKPEERAKDNAKGRKNPPLEPLE